MHTTLRRLISFLLMTILCTSILEMSAVAKKKPKRRSRTKVTKVIPVILAPVMPSAITTENIRPTQTPELPQTQSRGTVTVNASRPGFTARPVRTDVPTVNATATAGQLIISEFRLRGPGLPGMASTPPLDEFIEIYNASGADHTVLASSGTGYGIAKSDGTTLCSIPNGQTILNKTHFLCANAAGFSLTGYPAGNLPLGSGDATYTTDIPDNAGIALFNNNTGGASYSLANRLDAVGSASEANTLYKEGTGYPALTPLNIDYSFVRDTCGKGGSVTAFGPCTLNGLPKDTGNNAADFIFVDTAGTNTAAGQRLGTPAPESLFSPIQRNSAATLSLLDPCAAAVSSPNRVRDLTSDPGNNSTFGTMEIRRTITNTTGSNIVRLRFRLVDVTTSPVPAGIADLRARTSSDGMVTVDRAPCGSGNSSITVLGTTLEDRFLFGAPAFQPNGGGLNSSLSAPVGFLTAIPPGGSIDVRFLLGVQLTGTFKFYVNVEALP